MVARRLSSYEWRKSQYCESETVFSENVLVPALSAVTEDLRAHGITVAGPGSGPISSVGFGLLSFWPDVALLYQRRRFLAVETKLLGDSARQQSLTQAIGQALLYRTLGYNYVMVALVDRAGRMTSAEAKRLSEYLALEHMGLLALSEAGRVLTALTSSPAV